MGRNLLEVAQEVIWMEGKSEFALLMFKEMMKEGEVRKSANEEQ
jgi:hypothetical protein